MFIGGRCDFRLQLSYTTLLQHLHAHDIVYDRWKIVYTFRICDIVLLLKEILNKKIKSPVAYLAYRASPKYDISLKALYLS